jgi:CRP-like cAMP-binding protein
LLNKKCRFATHNYFIESGIIKASVNNEDIMKEVIIGFPNAGDFILTCSSVSIEIPLLLNLEVINDAVIYSINKENWNELIKLKKISNEFIIQCVQKPIIKFIEQIKINSYPKSKIRYQKSLENYPCLKQIKDEYVASFLGLNVRTISRAKSV